MSFSNYLEDIVLNHVWWECLFCSFNFTHCPFPVGHHEDGIGGTGSEWWRIC